MRKRKRMGRPPKKAKERRSGYVPFRMTKEELARVKEAAKREGLSVSEYLRRKVIS